MNGAILLIVALAAFLAAYVAYGAFLARKWGVDPVRKTAAYEYQDGKDYTPTNIRVLFGHHLASTTGSSPVTGAVTAAMFGWLPVFLWILVGSIFVGGVQNFSSILVSLRSGGRSGGDMIEQEMGFPYKLVFTGFAWVVVVFVIANFLDFTADIFAGIGADGELLESQGAVTTAAILSVPLALLVGWLHYRRSVPLPIVTVVGLAGFAGCFWLGSVLPLCFEKSTCLLALGGYIFLASVLPIWVLQQPRDYLTSFLVIALCIAGCAGVLVAAPTLHLPAFTSFFVDETALFPGLFLAVSGGAVSGYHSLVSGAITAKQITNERDARRAGYGGMLVGAVLAVLALIAVSSLYGSGMPTGTPYEIFATAVARFLTTLGLPAEVTSSAITLMLSMLSLAFLDTAARLGRYFFRELFLRAKLDDRDVTGLHRFLTAPWLTALITVGAAVLLALSGYESLWPVFAEINAVLAVLALFTAALWLKREGKRFLTCLIPALFLLAVTLTGLVYSAVLSLVNIGQGELSPLPALLRAGAMALTLVLLVFFVLRALHRLALWRPRSENADGGQLVASLVAFLTSLPEKLRRRPVPAEAKEAPAPEDCNAGPDMTESEEDRKEVSDT